MKSWGFIVGERMLRHCRYCSECK